MVAFDFGELSNFIRNCHIHLISALSYISTSSSSKCYYLLSSYEFHADGNLQAVPLDLQLDSNSFNIAEDQEMYLCFLSYIASLPKKIFKILHQIPFGRDKFYLKFRCS